MKILILLLLTSCAHKYRVVCKDGEVIREYVMEKFSFTKSQLLFSEENTHIEEDITKCEVEE